MKFGEVYIGFTELAREIGWSRQRLTHNLKRCGAVVYIGDSKRGCTTRALLKAHFPDIYRLIRELEHEEKEF